MTGDRKTGYHNQANIKVGECSLLLVTVVLFFLANIWCWIMGRNGSHQINLNIYLHTCIPQDATPFASYYLQKEVIFLLSFIFTASVLGYQVKPSIPDILFLGSNYLSLCHSKCLSSNISLISHSDLFFCGNPSICLWLSNC